MAITVSAKNFKSRSKNWNQSADHFFVVSVTSRWRFFLSLFHNRRKKGDREINKQKKERGNTNREKETNRGGGERETKRGRERYIQTER